MRELRQNLSKYLELVKAGETLIVTERGEPVARLVPTTTDPVYALLARKYGATIPTGRLEDVVARLEGPAHPAGTADALLAEARAERLP